MQKTSAKSPNKSTASSTGKPKRTSGKTQKRKDEILLAALACFTEHGLAATTIDMIRQQSGASVGSLYHHFGSKESIAAALFMRGTDDHFQHLRHALMNSKTTEQGVKAVVRTYCEWISENPDWARFIFSSRGEVLNSDQAEKLKEENKVHFDFLQSWFKPRLEAGELKNYPFAIYHSLLVGPAQDYAKLWLSGRVRKPLQDYIELFCDAAWQTLCP